MGGAGRRREVEEDVVTEDVRVLHAQPSLGQGQSATVQGWRPQDSTTVRPDVLTQAPAPRDWHRHLHNTELVINQDRESRGLQEDDNRLIITSHFCQ